MFCAAGAGDVKRFVNKSSLHGATASASISSKAYRCEGYLASVQIQPVIFSLFRYTSASCSSPSAIATRRRGKQPRYHGQVPATKTCGVAVNGLGTTAKYLRGAARSRPCPFCDSIPRCPPLKRPSREHLCTSLFEVDEKRRRSAWSKHLRCVGFF
jgi:hypothetical protein